MLKNEGTKHAIGVEETDLAINGLFDGSGPGKYAIKLRRRFPDWWIGNTLVLEDNAAEENHSIRHVKPYGTARRSQHN